MATKHAPLNYSDSQRISLVLGNTLDLTQLVSSSNQLGFSDVALKGEIIGGAASSPEHSREYVVKSGDTLSTIADSFNLHSGTLVLANPDIKDTEMIQPGQVLAIPDQDASESDLEQEYNQRLKKLAQSSAAMVGKNVYAAVTNGYIRMIAPVASYIKTRGFVRGGHTGDDLATAYGTPIVAAASGCMIHQGIFGAWNGGYGNLEVFDHGNGITTLYGHMSAYAHLVVGSCVTQGQVIGYVGSTGNSTGPHVHFEVRVNGVQVDPSPYY